MPLFDGPLENRPVDPSEEFAKQHNHFFVGQKLEYFDPRSASGKIRWGGFSLEQRVSYHQVTLPFADQKAWIDVPPNEYEDVQDLPFSISFVTPRTVRLRLAARPQGVPEEGSLMLDGESPTDGSSWEPTDDGSSATYAGPFGSLTVERDPWHLEFRDASGGPLTRTHHPSYSRGELNSLPIPFAFIRRSSDMHRHFAATFSLTPGERLFGGGESFTRLDKRGQKMVLWTCDAYGAQTPYMYKPVPFFMSSRGYGMFVHTSAPLTFDLGHSYDGAATIFLGDDLLDLFFFFGSPKEILSEYTALTGRAPTPPLWTFGLWMGRNSYQSEDETHAVAKKLREERIPSDVIHLDTGWFEVPSRCDFEFSPSRFPTPEKMLSELAEDGFRVSLWQLPYLNPNNELHAEAMGQGFAIRSASGRPPVDDAVIDLSDPEAERWYKDKLARLLGIGAGIFTADFGEAAPLSGLYASGQASFLEHNLYPLRYNKAVSEATEEASGHGTIYARSAWAGSQRYPLHWGGRGDHRRRHGRNASGRPLFGAVRFLLLESLYRGVPLPDASRPLPEVAGLRRAFLPQPLPRDAPNRAVGVRRRVHGWVPPHRGDALPAHALHLRPSEALLGRGLPYAQDAVFRVPGRPGLLDGGGRVHVRGGYPRRSPHGGDAQ
jgi:alpha-D-xyloside xylohydrolase